MRWDTFRRPSNYSGTHVITGIAATDSGGVNNTASGDQSTVAGGQINAATAQFSIVGGGLGNVASALEAAVLGGAGNIASAEGASVVGGQDNNASGTGAFVGGGGIFETSVSTSISGNVASGQSSMIPGGFGNLAGGDFSFAAGRRARVRTPAIVGGGDTDGDQGTFLWADATDLNFTSVGPNEFAVRATGGFRLVTAVDVATGAHGDALGRTRRQSRYEIPLRPNQPQR